MSKEAHASALRKSNVRRSRYLGVCWELQALEVPPWPTFICFSVAKRFGLAREELFGTSRCLSR